MITTRSKITYLAAAGTAVISLAATILLGAPGPVSARDHATAMAARLAVTGSSTATQDQHSPVLSQWQYLPARIAAPLAHTRTRHSHTRTRRVSHHGARHQITEITHITYQQAATQIQGSTAEQAAAELIQESGWPDSEYQCLYSLWDRESGWDVTAANATTGAYGIPQALPGSKMATAGPDWQTSAITQIRWGLGYIRDTYGSPCAAWWHELADGWY